MYYYKSCKDDSAVIDKLTELSEKHSRRGCDKFYSMIRSEGIHWNYKRVRRVYCLLKLNIRRKMKKRLPARVKVPLAIPVGINRTWSMDFMSDALISGRKIRVLNVMDDFNREMLAIEPDTSIPSVAVIRTLENIIDWRGKPEKLRVDNGPEFTSDIFVGWCKEQKIKLQFIQPGKPNQNGYIERFNKTYRNEVLDTYLFEDMDQVRIISWDWMEEYNTTRPHESLNEMTPQKYKELSLLMDSGKLEKSFPQSTRDFSSNNRNN